MKPKSLYLIDSRNDIVVGEKAHLEKVKTHHALGEALNKPVWTTVVIKYDPILHIIETKNTTYLGTYHDT